MCQSCGCTPCEECGQPIEDGVCTGCEMPAEECVCALEEEQIVQSFFDSGLSYLNIKCDISGFGKSTETLRPLPYRK